VAAETADAGATGVVTVEAVVTAADGIAGNRAG